MARNGTVVRKFFLHLSKKEQKQRFLARLDARRRTGSSLKLISVSAIAGTIIRRLTKMRSGTPRASMRHGNVVPADNKWFTHLVVAAAVVETLEDLNLSYPNVDEAKLKEIKEARRLLSKK